MSDDKVSPTGTELRPWWKSAWLWVGGAISVVAIGACVYFGIRLGTGPANDLAGIASFAAAVVSIVVTVVQGRRSGVAPRSPAIDHANAQTSTDPIEPVTTPLSTHLLHVDETGTAPRVSQVPDARLGVRSAVRQAEFGPTPYLERDVDEELTAAIRAGGMVVLYGPATAGKSRTATTLLKNRFGDRDLYVPAEVSSLRALLDSGHQPQDAVVWLDNLEEYLGDGGIDRAVLSRLCPPGRGDVTVVATLRYEEYRKHGLETDADQSGDDKPHPAGTALLRELKNQGRLISLAAELSDTERAGIARTQTDARPGDTRLSEAAESGRGFGEHLGAGEEMMQRWISGGNTLEKFGAAYISAAVDARRAGYHGPIPTDALAELAEGYLPAGLRDRGNLPTPSDAVTWATQPVVGTETSACLVPHRSGGYRAEDYLIDRADTPPSPLAGKPIHDTVWPTVLSLAAPEHLNTIGFAAHQADNLDIALTAWTRSATSGDVTAMFSVGSVLHDRGRLDDAETWWRKAIDAGSTRAMVNLAVLLERQGDIEQAETWHRAAINAGESHAMHNLAVLLEQRGDYQQAEAWHRKAADRGNAYAMVALGSLLEKRGDSEQAATWRNKAIMSSSLDTMLNLGNLLRKRGETRRAETWYRAAAETGDAFSMFTLANLLGERGDTDQAEIWHRKAAEFGHVDSMLNLGNLLRERGDTTGAADYWRKAADTGDTGAMYNLGTLLHIQGDIDQAETWYRAAVAAGHSKAKANLGILLRQQGNTYEAADWLRQAESAGHARTIRMVRKLLDEDDGREGAPEPASLPSLGKNERRLRRYITVGSEVTAVNRLL